MNTEHDPLGYDAYCEWPHTENCTDDPMWDAWRESARRARENRWAAFSLEELRELSLFIECSRVYTTTTNVEDEINAEIEARAALEGKE